MRFISHRGNLRGIEPANENRPEYLLHAISEGFEVEADLWRVKEEWFLGHDEPQYKISEEFLLHDKMWCHAKNINAFENLLELNTKCFWHQTDDYTLTSNGFIWAYPGSELTSLCICVLPERFPDEFQNSEICAGICSDYIEVYRKKND